MLLTRLSLSTGDEITPRISQPIAANGGSVQQSLLQLLKLNATIKANPPPRRERVCTSALIQLLIASHILDVRRARNTKSTGKPAIAAHSTYEL